MASVNFSEKEYEAVATAAYYALRKGDRDGASLLNELASKMNHALTGARHPATPGFRGVARKKYRAPGPIDKELGIAGEPSGDHE